MSSPSAVSVAAVYRGARLDKVLSEGTLRRIKAQWADPSVTMRSMVLTHHLSQERIVAICKDLPPRPKMPKLRTGAPYVGRL